MGYGTPAAVAAKSVHQDRVVFAVCGDGDFLITGQEAVSAFDNICKNVILNGSAGGREPWMDPSSRRPVEGLDERNARAFNEAA
jgi:acetolactate synthase I/II/III large subunit